MKEWLHPLPHRRVLNSKESLRHVRESERAIV